MKNKFSLEFDMKGASISLLWKYISSPQGLSQWFADEVVQDGKSVEFKWNGEASTATIVSMRAQSYIRLRWDDDADSDKEYFEMRVVTSELTADTTLIVTDFSDNEDDRDDVAELWNQQVDSLRRLIGV